MDVTGFWNQLLLNSAVCIPSTIPVVQGIQIITPFITSNDTNSSVGSDSVPLQEEPDDGDGDGETIDENECQEDIDNECEVAEGDEPLQKRSIQRVRYSKEEYRCKQCPYTCTTEKAFLRHLRWCESGEVQSTTHPLSCPICGKDRKDEETLSIHMIKHKDDKHFCCDICKFKSLQLKKLIQHRRMHTGEKPHLCPFCSYRSSRRDNLRSHVRRVHKKNDLPCDTFTPRSMVLSPRKIKEN